MSVDACGRSANRATDAIGRFLGASHEWESASVPIERATRLLAWVAFAGPPASIAWVVLGPRWLRNSGYLKWAVVGDITRFTFLERYQLAAVVSFIAIFTAGCFLVVVTEGFRLAGRRLLWITCVHSVVGTIAFLPPAVALLAAIVTVALFIALGIAVIAVVIALIASAL